MKEKNGLAILRIMYQKNIELLYLTPNTEYNVKVQLKKNRILSEVAEIEFRTEMPEQIPILKLVEVTENETKG